MFDDLESTPPNRVPAFIRQLSNSDAGWLARFVLEKVRKEKENLGDVVEKELAVSAEVFIGVTPVLTEVILGTLSAPCYIEFPDNHSTRCVHRQKTCPSECTVDSLGRA